MRDPNMRLTRKFGGPSAYKANDSAAPEARTRTIPMELLYALTAEGAPDLKALESNGFLAAFLRSWNTPSILKQVKIAAGKMKADGVDLKKKEAVKAWVDKHNEDLESGSVPTAPVAKPVVKSGPDVGRNDPCPCGSKKKFKKCCQGK